VGRDWLGEHAEMTAEVSEIQVAVVRVKGSGLAPYRVVARQAESDVTKEAGATLVPRPST
jgi:hypothetical protein